jgi:hypothetical protein
MNRATQPTMILMLFGLTAACHAPGASAVATHELTLFADYHQFYLQDEAAVGDLSDAWTADATARLLALAKGAIGVGTARNMKVPVVVEVFAAEPAIDLAAWDQVHDCSIDVPSGRLVVAGCTDYFPDAKRIELTPGTYRARVCYGALASVSADGLDGEDHYRIVLWPGTERAPSTIKHRPDGGAAAG